MREELSKEEEKARRKKHIDMLIREGDDGFPIVKDEGSKGRFWGNNTTGYHEKGD